jgi:hypothetical protein
MKAKVEELTALVDDIDGGEDEYSGEDSEID